MSGAVIAVEAFVHGDPPSAEFEAVRGLADAAPEPVAPGTPCLIARRDGAALARCTLFEPRELQGAAGPSGLVGHYEALDAGAGVAVLEAARARLAARGAARVLGPMNGSTWARYRLALPREAGETSFYPDTFPGEPRNPPGYPAHWEAAGFAVAARYESRIEEAMGADPPDAAELARGVAAAGFTVRPFDLERWADELDEAFAISLEAFPDNLYYTPIDAPTFRAMYEPVRARLDGALLLWALDRARRRCGYVFAYPDPGSARDGRPTRVIVKTLAVAPDARGVGLGHHLVDRLRLAARERGYESLIHALMYVGNVSLRVSARQQSRLFRRYALYEWRP